MHGIKKLSKASDDTVRYISRQKVSWSGRRGLKTLEIDSGHENKKIGSHPKSLRSFLKILCVVDDSICVVEGTSRALREDAFGDLAWLAITYSD